MPAPNDQEVEMRCKLQESIHYILQEKTRVSRVSQQMTSDGMLVEVHGTSQKHYKEDHMIKETDRTSKKSM